MSNNAWYFEMYEGANPKEAYKLTKIHPNKVPLTNEQLDKTVYPNDDWILIIETDYRAFNNDLKKAYDSFKQLLKSKYGSNTCDLLTIKRTEYFTKNATLRQVLERIANGMCYGSLNGFYQTDEFVFSNIGKDRKPVFRLSYST